MTKKDVRWTPTERALLTSLYANSTQEAITAAIPTHTWKAIVSESKRLKLPRVSESIWSEAELVILRDNYVALGATATAELLPGRSVVAVMGQANKREIGIKKHKRLTPAEEQLIKTHFETVMPVQQLADMLGRKRDDVYHFANKLGLSRRGKGLVRKGKPAPKPRMRPAKIRKEPAQKVEPAVKPAKVVTPKVVKEKPVKPLKDKPVKAAKVVAPKLEKKPARPVEVPQMVAVTTKPQKSTTKKKGKGEDNAGPGTAAYIRKLPYASEERMAYLRGGRSGWEAYMKAQKGAVAA